MVSTSIKPNDGVGRALERLAAGDVCAFPTDTYYALGADATNGVAVAAVYDLKRRALDLPLPVLIYDFGQIEPFLSSLPPIANKIANLFWPGALTLVLPANDKLPAALRPQLKIGVRVPDHRLALHILRACGTPLTGTSANLSGTPPTKHGARVAAQFPDIPLVEGRCGVSKTASTVLDLSEGRPKVLRHGTISKERLLEYLPTLKWTGI